MTTDSESLTAALRRALSTTPADRYVETPSALRAALVRELGADANEYRGPIHLLVAAADERLPQSLSAAAPVDSGQMQRIASTFAANRGLSAESALTTVETWADAMGVLAEPLPAVGPAPSGSGASLDVTSLPPAGVVPSTEGAQVGPRVAGFRTADVGAGGVGVVGGRPGGSTPPPGAPLIPPPPPDPVAAPALPWPKSNAKRLAKAVACEGRPPSGAYPASHPRSPLIPMLTGLALGALILVIYAVAHVLIGVLPLLLVVFLVRRYAPEGTLVVDESGARFYRRLAPGAVPAVSFAWSEATVGGGPVPRLDFPRGTVWLRIWSSSLAAVMRSRTPGAGGSR